MLELRPGCENCDRDLAPDSSDAWICSFECTWCASCAESFGRTCPNCQGVLMPRPGRATQLLAKFPASSDRTFKPVAG